MTAEEDRFFREMDILRQEHNRDIDRVERSIQSCVTETFYVQAQKQTGERIEAVNGRVTAIETKSEGEKQERQSEKFQVRLMLGSSIFVLISTLCAELLRIVWA